MKLHLLGLFLLTAACITPPPPAQAPNVLAVGSKRDSRVAMEVTSATGPLLYLTNRLSGADLLELQELAPNVRFVSGLSVEERIERAAEFHAADANLLTPEFLAAATNLRWAQSWSAGVDRYLGLDALIENDQIVLTNMKGIHGPVIAEHVMTMILALSRDLPAYLRAQGEGQWDRNAGSGQRALAGSTILVAGMGGIGSEVARRAHGFDMRVLATVRTKRSAPDYVHELGTSADLERFLAEADVVAICLPLTEETRGMFNAKRLALMKDDALLINIGRGPIIDTDALVKALQAGTLGGAGLDVTDPEPLPFGHPLWAMANVIITPHNASTAALTGTRRGLLFNENLRRFSTGEALLNVVNKNAGY